MNGKQEPGPPVGVFIAVAFGTSWLLWLPLVLQRFVEEFPRMPDWYFAIGSAGPLLGAIAAVSVRGGSAALGPWARARWLAPGKAIGWLWSGAAIALGLVAALAAEALTTGSIASATGIGLTDRLPGWAPWQTLPLWIASYGFCEESGWRGWLYPALSGRYGRRAASLLVVVVWVPWHLPQFLFNHTFMTLGWGVVGWIIGLAAGSVLLSAVFSEGSDSLWPLVIFHGIFDFITASDTASTWLAPLMSAGVMVLAPFAWKVLRETPKCVHGSRGLVPERE